MDIDQDDEISTNNANAALRADGLRNAAATRCKTRAEREAAKGRKAGNPGVFDDAVDAVLEQLLEEYKAIPKGKGTVNKNKRLAAHWTKAYGLLWEKFEWNYFTQFYPGVEGEAEIT